MEHEYTVKNLTLLCNGEPVGSHHNPAKLQELADVMNQRNKERADAQRMMRERKSVCG
jgi:hypothetical protein